MRQSDNEADDTIVRRVAGGDLDAFERLIDRHSKHVFRVVSRHVPAGQVHEVAHETFVQAFLSLDRYRPGGAFLGWLTSIALRRCADHWRSAYREREVYGRQAGRDATGEPPAFDRPDPRAEREARQREDRELLRWALSRLDPEDRLVLTMEYLEDLEIRACAEALGWTESKVKVRALRARRRLKELLAGLAPRTESRS